MQKHSRQTTSRPSIRPTQLALALGGALLSLAAHDAHAAACAGTQVLYATSDAQDMATSGKTGKLGWGDAVTLQNALTVANADTTLNQCYEVRIKQGVYKPATLSPTEADSGVINAARSMSFNIARPMLLKGGYTGSGDTRVVQADNTVLSGDIDGNDLVEAGITRSAELSVSDLSSPFAVSGDLKGNNSTAVVVVGPPVFGGPPATPLSASFTSAPGESSFTQLEGLTITGGNSLSATGGPVPTGRGLSCTAQMVEPLPGAPMAECSPALQSMRFSGNAGFLGSAVSLPMLAGTNVTNLSIEQSTFSGNATAITGAVFAGWLSENATGSGTIRISRSTFSSNRSMAIGGAVTVFGSSSSTPLTLDINNSLFDGNVAGNGTLALPFPAMGGAIALSTSSGSVKARISGSTFRNNTAAIGGGAIAQFGANFLGNANAGSGDVQIESSTFSGNAAPLGGAIASLAMYSTVGSGGPVASRAHTLTITNSTFNANQAKNAATPTGAPEGIGGAIANLTAFDGNTSAITIRNSTFSGNTSDQQGSAVANTTWDMAGTSAPGTGRGQATLDIQSSILWPGTSGTGPATAVFNGEGTATPGDPGATPPVAPINTITPTDPATGSATTVVAHSIIQGGWSATGSANLDADPLLAPLADNGGSTQTMLPARNSPAINAVACSVGGSAVDQRGEPRPDAAGSACDIGAVELKLGSATGSTQTPDGTPVDVTLTNPGGGGGSTPSTCTLLPGSPSFTDAPLTGGPAGFRFPYGQLRFTADHCPVGQPTQVTLQLPAGTQLPGNAQMFKKIGSEWVNWPATISGNTIRFTVTDSTDPSTAAATGDSDPTPGVIADPVLFAVPEGSGVTPTTTAVPTLSQWGLMALSGLLGLFAFGSARTGRQRRRS
ncbi:MAG: IPTL-CTERM sorting domain-containing protein [Burkholderiaceae bacterium]|jgi:hypothetical protein|nr:IPTL-CTERM sorting domain-containing protein [Burkholderiaceae bacterium]